MENNNSNLMLLCFFLLPLLCFSQTKKDEVGILFGLTTYAGDLSENYIEPNEMNLAGGFFIRHHLNSKFNIRIHTILGKLSGNDRNASVDSGLWKRNLNFHSILFELGLQVEWKILRLHSNNNQHCPYLFAGIAGFHFKPKTELAGKEYQLNLYNTEGVEYSLFNWAIPMGIGWQVCIGNKGGLGLELGFRKTFTDYLDDVSNVYPELNWKDDNTNDMRRHLSYRGNEVLDINSRLQDPTGKTRGNPEKNDWYMFFGVNLSFFIATQ